MIMKFEHEEVKIGDLKPGDHIIDGYRVKTVGAIYESVLSAKYYDPNQHWEVVFANEEYHEYYTADATVTKVTVWVKA